MITQLEPSGDLQIVDASTAIKPAVTNTWFILLVAFIVRKTFGGLSKSPPGKQKISYEQKGPSDCEEHSSGASTPQSGDESTNVQGRTMKKLATSKAGGMRRKNTKRR